MKLGAAPWLHGTAGSCGCSYDVPSMASDRTTDDEDLRLNALHRFAKHSPSLPLQAWIRLVFTVSVEGTPTDRSRGEP